jgi:endoglucanase
VFRGGVRPEYFEKAAVVFLTGAGKEGRVVSYAAHTREGEIRYSGPPPAVDDVATWRFRSQRAKPGELLAPACDDLAGCAAALAALDKARHKPELRHFGVLLTRAEEMGFIGAIHAAKAGTIPAGSRILSIEASRSSVETPVGQGPVIRVGDASTVFDHGLSNLITEAARQLAIPHQRRLMAGGSCEATAFGVYGHRAAGLCLALGNYHNMGNLDQVESGTGQPVALMEQISLADFHALIDLLLVSARAVDGASGLVARLDGVYDEGKHLLF